jgi:hypothetical protein
MDKSEPQVPDGRARRDFIFAAVVLGCVFVGLLAMTWRKWPDMMLDFGLQLYMPWKISNGAVLYRDLAYMTGGPFSQYLDAGLFHVCGVAFMTLAMFNLALLVLMVLMVYRCFYQAADQLTALMCGLAILLVFAFSHYSDYGIFNYVTPYCEEVYQGLILSIATVALLARWVNTQKIMARHHRRSLLWLGLPGQTGSFPGLGRGHFRRAPAGLAHDRKARICSQRTWPCWFWPAQSRF